MGHSQIIVRGKTNNHYPLIVSTLIDLALFLCFTSISSPDTYICDPIDSYLDPFYVNVNESNLASSPSSERLNVSCASLMEALSYINISSDQFESEDCLANTSDMDYLFELFHSRLDNQHSYNTKYHSYNKKYHLYHHYYHYVFNQKKERKFSIIDFCSYYYHILISIEPAKIWKNIPRKYKIQTVMMCMSISFIVYVMNTLILVDNFY